MKNYNKILEAVNRGILLALDDFDDEEQVLNIKSKLVNHRDYTKEYLDLIEETVDLDLPSGILWCKYNLGVNPNLLFKAEDWYGDYYSWGELEPNKKECDWSNYKFGEDYNKITKYCNNRKRGLNRFTDNLTLLLPEDDAAYQNKKFYNYKFHIPTKELLMELKNYTNNYWVNNYNPSKIKHTTNDGGIQGLNGRIFEGTNGNHLFIPAAGHRSSNIFDVGSDCNIWSSRLDLDNPNNAYYLYFNSRNIGIIDCFRYFGCSVRPVINL